MAHGSDEAMPGALDTMFLNASMSVDEETTETTEPRGGAFSSTAPMAIDVLKISSEDLAVCRSGLALTLQRQITILDLAAFRSIKAEVPLSSGCLTVQELRNGAWLGKDKFERAPHVVDCTRRFNHVRGCGRLLLQVAFWITREILQATSQVTRVDRLVHFIKVAKVKPPLRC